VGQAVATVGTCDVSAALQRRFGTTEEVDNVIGPAPGKLSASADAPHFIGKKEMYECMKIQFRILGLTASASMRAWLELQLERLRHLMPVSTAEVVLERQRDGAPAFRAQVHLAVPGPDIHAEACDYTLQAAWLKVAKKLRHQIERRKTRQQLRHKGQPKHPLTAGRWSVAPVAGRI
jgi:ribosomal subunit interface protein